jgi:hypothetical protein
VIPLAGFWREDEVHREVAVFDHGSGMVDKEERGKFGPDFAFENSVDGVEAWGAVSGVVTVGGDDVSVSGPKELPGRRTGGKTKLAGEGHGGELCAAAASRSPAGEDLRGFLEDGIAFGVCDNRNDANGDELAQNFVHGGRIKEFGELDHEIPAAIDGEAGGVAEGFLDVDGGKVKIAREVDAGNRSCGGVSGMEDFIAEGGVAVWIEGIGGIGVGRGDDIGSTGGGGEAEHGKGVRQGTGAVVKAIKDVAVDIDHRWWSV